MSRKQRVLFVCVENSCRSRIAEGFARYYGDNIIEPYNAESSPLYYELRTINYIGIFFTRILHRFNIVLTPKSYNQ